MAFLPHFALAAMDGAFPLRSIPPHAAFVPLGLRGQCSAGGGALFADAQALANILLHLLSVRSAIAELICGGSSHLNAMGRVWFKASMLCLRPEQQGFSPPGDMPRLILPAALFVRQWESGVLRI